MKIDLLVLALKIINYVIITIATLVGTIAHFGTHESFEKIKALGRPPIGNQTKSGWPEPPEDAYLEENVFVYFTISTMMTLTMDMVIVNLASRDAKDRALHLIDLICHAFGGLLVFLAGCLILSSVDKLDKYALKYYTKDYEDKKKTLNQNSDLSRLVSPNQMLDAGRRTRYMYGEKIAAGIFCFIGTVLCVVIVVMMIVQMVKECRGNRKMNTSPSKIDESAPPPPPDGGAPQPDHPAPASAAPAPAAPAAPAPTASGDVKATV